MVSPWLFNRRGFPALVSVIGCRPSRPAHDFTPSVNRKTDVMDAFLLSNMPANRGDLLYLSDIRELYLVSACVVHRAAAQSGSF